MFFSSILFLVPVRMTSIHSAYVEEVHDVPMSEIIRPFIPELDEEKVESLMVTIQVIRSGNYMLLRLILLLMSETRLLLTQAFLSLVGNGGFVVIFQEFSI